MLHHLVPNAPIVFLGSKSARLSAMGVRLLSLERTAIDWWCAPEMDSPPLFNHARLRWRTFLDHAGGATTITLRSPLTLITTAKRRPWAAQLTYDGPFAKDLVRALSLKFLLFSETGAIAAAATAGLPERIGGDENYDYRFARVRDAVSCIRMARSYD